VSIQANVQVPSKGNSVVATQPTQSIVVQQTEGKSIQVLDRQSIVGIQGAADKHKTLSININDWTSSLGQFYVDLTHGINKKCSVVVVDSFNQTQYPDIIYNDNNTVRLITSAQFSGKVHFN
jgi:hypothetical protein